MQSSAWLELLFAKAMSLPRRSLTLYCIPEEYASSRIVLMKSIEGLVPGWISLWTFRAMSCRSPISLLIVLAESTVVFSLRGKPLLIVAMGTALHLVRRRRREDLPAKTLTSIPSEKRGESRETSPS